MSPHSGGGACFTIQARRTTVRVVNAFSSQLIAQFISGHLYWVFLGIIFLNITQRKHRATAARKRVATIYLAVAALVIHTASNLVLAYDGSDLHVVAVLLITVGAVAYFRDRAFPFTLRCRASGKLLDVHTVLYRDSNILPEFDEQAETEQARPEDAEGSKADADTE